MNLLFKFSLEKGPAHIVQMTPNLLLIHNKEKKRKRDLIILFSIVATLFFVASLLLYVYKPASYASVFFIIPTGLLVGIIGIIATSDTLRAIEIYTCIMTEEFEEYINSMIAQAMAITDPDSPNILFLSKREIKEVNKMLPGMEALKEIAEACMEMDDLEDELNLLKENIHLIYGFKIKKKL